MSNRTVFREDVLDYWRYSHADDGITGGPGVVGVGGDSPSEYKEEDVTHWSWDPDDPALD